MSTYPSFTPHKYIKKIAELKIVVDIKTIEVQRLYLISKQEGASRAGATRGVGGCDNPPEIL